MTRDIDAVHVRPIHGGVFVCIEIGGEYVVALDRADAMALAEKLVSLAPQTKPRAPSCGECGTTLNAAGVCESSYHDTEAS